MDAIRQAQAVFTAVGRKSWMACRRLPRTVSRVTAEEHDYARHPPVLITTVPKSGTHLLYQIVGALPGAVDYGTFLDTLSFRHRPRPLQALLRAIRALAPGEVVRAHLFHRPEIVEALRSKHALTIFLCRDPRDVILSEAYYLANLAPWQSLHRAFARRTPEQRIDLGIRGLPGSEKIYPDVGERYEWYEGWLDDADVVLRFEELMSDRRQQVIEDLVRCYKHATGLALDVVDVAGRATAAIEPSRSHTYREGRVGTWREAFSPEQTAEFNRVAGRMLLRYGYVDDRSQQG